MPSQPAIRVIRRSGASPVGEGTAQRHRLLVELHDAKPLDEAAIRAYLRQLAQLCSMRLLAEPFVASLEPVGQVGWMHAEDGGAQLQAWGEPTRLLSVSLVSAAPIDPEQVVRFSALSFAAAQALATDPAEAGAHWKTTAEAAALRQLCEWAIGEARSGKDLARAATLVVGAGLVGELAGQLLARIAKGVLALHSAGDAKLALAHGEGLGEALLLLRHAGVDIGEDLAERGAQETAGTGS